MSLPINRRIVVTGMGVVSPLGCGIEPVWSRLINSESGIKRLSDEFVDGVDVKVAATVPLAHEDPNGFNIDYIVSPKFQRKMDKFIHFALDAAGQALQQAQWAPVTDIDQERTSAFIGSSIGGFTTIARAIRSFDEKGAKGLSPSTIPAFLINMAAGQISIRYGVKGPTSSPTTACAASAHAIGDGIRMLLSGETDVALCGGAESCIDSVILSSFVASHAVATHFNDEPTKASRPFSTDRQGFVLGEGSAMLVIETLDHALKRGAQPIAEIVGYSACSEAYHPTACLENGDALQSAMRGALRSAKLKPEAIGYINAHGTSTPLGDKSEFLAIREVFGIDSPVSVSSTKSSVGHLLGAAGAIECIFTILSLRDGILPPTLNLDNPDPLFQGVDLIGPEARRKDILYAMSNSAGFGGVNSSLIFKKWLEN